MPSRRPTAASATTMLAIATIIGSVVVAAGCGDPVACEGDPDPDHCSGWRTYLLVDAAQAAITVEEAASVPAGLACSPDGAAASIRVFAERRYWVVQGR